MMSNFAALFPVNSFVAPPVKTTCTCQNARLVKNTREAIPGEKRQKTRAHKNASAPKYIKMRQKRPERKRPIFLRIIFLQQSHYMSRDLAMKNNIAHTFPPIKLVIIYINTPKRHHVNA